MRTQLGPTFEKATALIQTMARLRAALQNFLLLLIGNLTDRTISIKLI